MEVELKQTSPAVKHYRKQTGRRGFLILLVSALTMLPICSYGQGQARPQSVLVTVTTRGIQLSSSTVRPGQVTFIIVNRTPAATLDVDITPTAVGAALVSRVLGLRSGKRLPERVSLGAGTYAISVRTIPSNRSILTVAP